MIRAENLNFSYDKNTTFIKDLNVEVIETDLIKIAKGYVKHDSDHLAQILMTTILDKKLLYDKDKIIEYMYLSKKIGDRVK